MGLIYKIESYKCSIGREIFLFIFNLSTQVFSAFQPLYICFDNEPFVVKKYYELVASPTLKYKPAANKCISSRSNWLIHMIKMII